MIRVLKKISLQSVLVWLLIALLVGIIAYVCFRKGLINKRTLVAFPVLAFYLSFVAKITVFTRIPTPYPQYAIRLFWSYRAIANGATSIIAEVFWNVVLFIPIGILLMLILNCRYDWLVSAVIGLLISSCIELIQLVFHLGLFEFDDIVHNTLGAAIGVGLYLLVCLLVKKFRRK